jgi:hypothetical protein
MRTIKKIIWTTLLLLLFAGVHANAQFLKKVKNKAEKSVEKTNSHGKFLGWNNSS